MVFLFTPPTPGSALTLSHSGGVTSVASAEGDPSCRKGWDSDGKHTFLESFQLELVLRGYRLINEDIL